ncbi:SMI1/KNR4 family protein [Streptomyces sp. WAC05458]|uniref:SMI1/KNR4 family protein n=1 Tax=Streptomyces sp. WAC05458 TaxID=2487412 RepID=UPI000F93ED25|nr:SMI1/KNR4 family protein [Streptomyces sp. WAC05458]RSS26108.1 SMI1/KNR4 family protein [Streptomyces sp. WAC05458]
MDVSMFREILGPPLLGGDLVSDWRDVEERSLVTLPGDYKEFISAYGPGVINGQLYVFHPKGESGGEGLRLEVLWEQAANTYSELARESPDLYPYPVHPEPGGCIPVARSISGNHVFLAPPVDRGQQWSVIVEMGGWARFPMSFTDFLWKVLHDELEIPLIEGEPSFEAVGAVES